MAAGDKPGAKDPQLDERIGKLKERAAKLRAEGKERAAEGLEKQVERLTERSVSGPGAAPSKENRAKVRTARKLARVKLLHRRYGENLGKNEVRREVELHARRSAHLSRMKELTSAREDGETKQELLKRINRLMAKENARHSREMAQLTKSNDKLAGKKPEKEPAAPAKPEKGEEE